MKIYTPAFRCFLLILAIFLSLPVAAQNEDSPVRVYTETTEDYHIRFYADNSLIIPATIQVYFEKLQNLDPDADMPFVQVLEPGTTGVYLFQLIPGDGRSLSYRFAYTYANGDPFSVSPDEDFLYSFPFANGTKQRITQGYHGSFTHSGDNTYALDFDMDEGTPIHAARAGLVVEVKEDSNIGGPTAEYGPYANYILIMHEDGTFGNYVHLRQNGSEVSVGDFVTQGQFLGYSGSTGRASGPHLHFDVRIPLVDGSMDSIPIRFSGREGSAVSPSEGEIYYSYQPGGEPFDEVFGSTLSATDFADYRGRATKPGAIDFRTEQTDLTYVVFISNGFDYPISATVQLNLSRMSSTEASPVTLELPAGEERFLTILRPLDSANAWSYGFNVSYREIRR